MALTLVASLAALAAGPARAARHTVLAFDSDSYAADYSQGITLSATLLYLDDSAVSPADCQPGGAGQPCRVEFSLAPDATPDADHLLAPDADPVIDADGTATKRLVLVDGVYTDVTFVASDTGTAYLLTARFAGFGNPTEEECAPEAADVDDGDLCPVTATTTLLLTAEVPAIALTDGREGTLGDVIQLSAVVSDPNGDAQLGSSDLEGPGEKLLAGVPVSFFYDADGDGRPDGDSERIDTVLTNSAGVASLDFTLDPQFVHAGSADEGIHAEFSGDDRYGVARASTPLIVNASDVDPAATKLEVDPKEVPADGNSTITVRARLVDKFNNLLDANSADHDVRFTSELGKFQGDVVRDPDNGSYSQTLRASRQGGTSTITVFVDDVEGAHTDVNFIGEGCQCGHADLVTLAPCLLVLAARRRRR